MHGASVAALNDATWEQGAWVAFRTITESGFVTGGFGAGIGAVLEGLVSAIRNPHEAGYFADQDGHARDTHRVPGQTEDPFDSSGPRRQQMHSNSEPNGGTGGPRRGYNRAPRKPRDGTWLNADGTPGVEGDSYYRPNDATLRARLPNGRLRFIRGEPQFPAVEGVEVKIRMSGKDSDMSKARNAFAQQLRDDPTLANRLGISQETLNGFYNPDGSAIVFAIQRWEATADVLWHHCNDLQSMRLVDTRIHGARNIGTGTSHTGGAAYSAFVCEVLVQRGILTNSTDGLTPELIQLALQQGIIPPGVLPVP